MDPNDFRQREWGARPVCRVSGGGATIDDDVATALSFGDADEFDRWSMHDPSGSPTDITIPMAGLYLVGANVTFVAGTSGTRNLNILLNAGATFIRSQITTADTGVLNASGLIECASGDVITVTFRHVTGATLAIANPRAWVAFISKA